MLDEIGEMPGALQAKLLHVLQDREFTKLGSNRPVHGGRPRHRRDEPRPRADDSRGQFREDLYYRLQVIEIRVPPLRDRRDEILPLVEFFLHAVRGALRPAGRAAVGPAARGVHVISLAGQHPRARERHQAVRDPAGRDLVLNELQRPRDTDLAHPRRSPMPDAAGRGAAPAYAAAPPIAPAAPRRRRGRRTSRPAAGRAAAGRTATTVREAARARAAGGAQRRTRGDSAGARSLPLEPPQGRPAARRQLQDAAQQDEGVRHQRAGRVARLAGYPV